MDTIASRIQKVMEYMEMSYGELSKKTGIPKSALQRYVTGETPKIPIDRVRMIADALQVEAKELLGWVSADQPPMTGIRILGSIHCGNPVWAEETYDEYLTTSFKCDFALRAVGDSMIKAGIHDGDMVLIRSQDTADNKQIAVVCIGDDSTLKRVVKRGDKIVYLHPENDAYDDIYLDELDDPASVRILGIAVAVQHEL